MCKIKNTEKYFKNFLTKSFSLKKYKFVVKNLFKKSLESVNRNKRIWNITIIIKATFPVLLLLNKLKLGSRKIANGCNIKNVIKIERADIKIGPIALIILFITRSPINEVVL